MASSVASDDASMPSIRRPKRRAGRRLLMTALTTLLLLFSHTMKALLHFFRLLQHLGLLISDCAQKVLQHFGELHILVSVRAQKVSQHFRLLRTLKSVLQHPELISICRKKVLQHFRLPRSLKSVLQHSELISICRKKVLQHFRLLRSLKSVLQHSELISLICRKKVLQHLGLLLILISVCALKVLQRLRLPVRKLISVCEKKVLQHLGLLRVFISVYAKEVLQHKWLGDLGFLIPIDCAKKVLQKFLGLLRFLISLYPEKAICFLLYYINVVQPRKQIDTLLREVKGVILEHVDYEQVFRLKLLSRGWKALIDEIIPTLSLKKLPVLTACYFFTQNGTWQVAGFDPNWTLSGDESSVGKWRRFPPLPFLPSADLNPFLVCANNGLVCINFSKDTSERLIVFNPLTRIWRELPPMLNRRNPVLMHIIVNKSSHSYQILVAGSSSDDQEHRLSKVTELYDSQTQQWTQVGDLPGPAFALNEFQAGVFQNGNIFCIGFVKHNNEVVKGILGFNMVKHTWSTYRGLPDSSSTLQLVANDGVLYLFSEQIEDFGEFVDHCVDRVEWSTQKDKSTVPFKLVNVFKTHKIGGWSLDVDLPEYALLPYSKSRLCVYNTVDHTGEIYDVEDRESFELLQAINPEHGEARLSTLNHMSFTLEPRFDSRA